MAPKCGRCYILAGEPTAPGAALPTTLLGVEHHPGVGRLHRPQDPHLTGRDVDGHPEPVRVERQRARAAVVAGVRDPAVELWGVAERRGDLGKPDEPVTTLHTFRAEPPLGRVTRSRPVEYLWGRASRRGSCFASRTSA